jgi:hypothetical protein
LDKKQAGKSMAEYEGADLREADGGGVPARLHGSAA